MYLHWNKISSFDRFIAAKWEKELLSLIFELVPPSLSVRNRFIEKNIKNIIVAGYNSMNVETGNWKSLKTEARRETAHRPDESDTDEHREIIGEKFRI